MRWRITGVVRTYAKRRGSAVIDAELVATDADSIAIIMVMATGFIVGYALVSAFWCFEMLTNAATHTRLMVLMPDLWPNSMRHLASGGELPDYFLNQKMAGLAGLFFGQRS